VTAAYRVAGLAVGLGGFAGLVVLFGAPPYPAWLAAWSLATFAAYGLDKTQAIRGGWRVPERQLHGLALVGGAIGGWAGMLVFRHKIRKPVFVAVLIVSSVLEIGVAILTVRS
jgi:uncharacterized membrane protein YsdA (DUF1294 family)